MIGRHMNDGNDHEQQKKWTFDITKYKEIIKSISIDKWILIGLAGLVLVLCSDSCAGSGDKDSGGLLGSDDDGIASGGSRGDGSSSSGGNLTTESGASLDLSLDSYTDQLESELEGMLTSIEGVGAVQVMITLKGTSTKEVLMEEPYTEHSNIESDSEGGSRDTLEVSRDYRVVYEENSDGESVPFVVAEVYPEVEGVAVIAEGGDSATIKEKISSIIKALFGIEINKIAVGKMK